MMEPKIKGAWVLTLQNHQRCPGPLNKTSKGERNKFLLLYATRSWGVLLIATRIHILLKKPPYVSKLFMIMLQGSTKHLFEKRLPEGCEAEVTFKLDLQHPQMNLQPQGRQHPWKDTE